MSLQNKMPIDWDIDVIDYWQTSLSSYKKHHAQDITDIVTSDKVSKDILDTLPIKEQKEEEIETKPVVNIPVKRKDVTDEAQVGNWSVVVEQEEEQDQEEIEEEEEEKEEEAELEEEEVYEEEMIEEEKGEEPRFKKARYDPPQPQAVPHPPHPPQPPQQQDEALSNLMMAWYYAGYYTGLYQANQTQ